MQPTFFATPAAFRRWLKRNHDKVDELLVGFWKKGSGKGSITWPQSVDEALSFGWIDGVRRRIDDESYSIRFTPRRRGSIWSAVNIGRATELTKLGRMHPAGLRAFEARDEAKSRVYAYENLPREFTAEDEKRFRLVGRNDPPLAPKAALISPTPCSPAPSGSRSRSSSPSKAAPASKRSSTSSARPTNTSGTSRPTGSRRR